MTQDEFMKRYSDYYSENATEAMKEAIRVNVEGINGDAATVVNFGDNGFCLVLRSIIFDKFGFLK